MVVAAALIASGLWGAADFIGGTLSRRYAALAVAGAAQGVGFLFLLLILAGLGGTASWSIGAVAWGLLAGLCAITGLTLMYTALATGVMGVVSPIIAMSAIVPVGAGIAFGEMPRAVQMGGIAACLVGIVLVTRSPTAMSDIALGRRPLLLAGLAATTFGGSLVFLALGSGYDPLVATMSMRGAAAAFALVAAVFASGARGLDRRSTLPVVALGALDAGAYLAFGWASAAGHLASVSILSALYPLETAFLAFVVHHERLRRQQLVGVGFVIAGVVALVA